MSRDDRAGRLSPGSVLLEAGAFFAGIPIAVAGLLFGAVAGGAVGAVVAVVVLMVAATVDARSGLVGLAGGLLFGVVAALLILWAVAEARADL